MTIDWFFLLFAEISLLYDKTLIFKWKINGQKSSFKFATSFGLHLIELYFFTLRQFINKRIFILIPRMCVFTNKNESHRSFFFLEIKKHYPGELVQNQRSNDTGHSGTLNPAMMKIQSDHCQSWSERYQAYADTVIKTWKWQ